MAETCWAYSKDGWVFPINSEHNKLLISVIVTQNPNSVPVMAVLESGVAGRGGKEYFT
jgi:endonuclease III-like uncharacterized protein